MSPTISSHPMRRATAFLAIAWALSAILPSVAALQAPETGVDHPFDDARLGRVAVVYAIHPSAEAAGIAVGDRVIAFRGENNRAKERSLGENRTAVYLQFGVAGEFQNGSGLNRQ